MDSQNPSIIQPERPQSIAPRITAQATALCILAALALIITAYLIYLHYNPGTTSFCNINAQLNCDAVNQSKYSLFLGLPVAIIGFIAYLGILSLAYKVRKPPVLGARGRFSHMQLLQGIMILSGLGTVFSLYLTYIEAFVLQTWCILCVTQQIIILAIFIISLIALATIREDVEKRQVCEFC